MLTGDQALTDFIRRAIRQTGSVTFEWFMEQALYHPELGYYSSGRCALGRRGDYYTNVSVGPLFGRLLAAQFAEMWQRLGRRDDFVIVEQGAHHGDFARDVLEAVRERTPDFFRMLRYWMIEPFPTLRERQREALRDFSEKLTWEKSVNDLEPFCGVHFSNELLDSMPVRLISRVDLDAARMAAATADWEERRVVELGDGFGFVTTPIMDGELRRHLETIPRHSNGPYETEVNLVAPKWIEKVAQKLTRGYVLTVDYGYARDDFYAPERSSGTLQCRAQHRLVSSPFTGIGETDITAHVDWTSLAERAEVNGLSVAAFADQHHFMTGIVTGLMAEQFDVNANERTRRALQTLLHPEFLGTTFQFLALAKNVAAGVPLSGFKFARDPRVALGL